MDDIDVTEFLPDRLRRLSPAERARRDAVREEIMRTDFSSNVVFPNGFLRLIGLKPRSVLKTKPNR
jgi:hypothetical protein